MTVLEEIAAINPYIVASHSQILTIMSQILLVMPDLRLVVTCIPRFERSTALGLGSNGQ
jgi:hypothetical protein